jgi:hypothetical protein
MMLMNPAMIRHKKGQYQGSYPEQHNWAQTDGRCNTRQESIQICTWDRPGLGPTFHIKHYHLIAEKNLSRPTGLQTAMENPLHVSTHPCGKTNHYWSYSRWTILMTVKPIPIVSGWTRRVTEQPDSHLSGWTAWGISPTPQPYVGISPAEFWKLEFTFCSKYFTAKHVLRFNYIGIRSTESDVGLLWLKDLSWTKWEGTGKTRLSVGTSSFLVSDTVCTRAVIPGMQPSLSVPSCK